MRENEKTLRECAKIKAKAVTFLAKNINFFSDIRASEW